MPACVILRIYHQQIVVEKICATVQGYIAFHYKLLDVTVMKRSYSHIRRRPFINELARSLDYQIGLADDYQWLSSYGAPIIIPDELGDTRKQTNAIRSTLLLNASIVYNEDDRNSLFSIKARYDVIISDDLSRVEENIPPLERVWIRRGDKSIP
ncbi:hypothetical protein CEXT_30241 [Caerostris extrusa]|uniref:Uncharacterized protein n=1 Tax=Caerostris extrusa TaxID=172846 RepID=A0AAV4WS76_CAEEX|nr:hypothetical protein CEXT_30241 [Caerostris extrusa]